MAVQTKVIDNFYGSMTPYIYGDLNSGRTNATEVFAHDPWGSPGNLTWYEEPELIDPDSAVITDAIMAGKARVESGILYVYAIGHLGRLYKIQVNDPSTYNPSYDNPTLVTTLTVNSPTFTRGGFIDFFGATEKIYIGHDKGITSINYDGTGEAFVGVLGTWTQNVPRPLLQFLGKLYAGNGKNIAEIDSTATVTTYTKLSPAFPDTSQVRDLDITPDGNYLQAVVADQALGDITATTTPTAIVNPSNSYVFLWNGTDLGYSSFKIYPGIVLTASARFGDFQYFFGYDFRGGGVWNSSQKLISSSPFSGYGESPMPNAVAGPANLITWVTTLPFDGHLEALYSVFGTISEFEYESGYWSPLDIFATEPETDVIRIPCQIVVSNFARGASSNGYTDQIFGIPRIYVSTIETSSAPTTKYRLYKWNSAPSGLGTATEGAIYQTQTQPFSKKVQIKEVRVYGKSWVTGNSFTIDLIGSSEEPITGGSYTFAVGSTLTSGQDYAWYNPQMAPTYALAIRITNNGTVNHVITKIEVDYDDGGK